MPHGTMLAVVLPEEEVAPLLTGGLSLSAVNGPKLCVVSGPEEAVSALRQKLSGQGTVSRELKTSHAFHSSMMDPILAGFEAEVGRVPRNKPRIPIVSSLFGRVATDEEWTDPGYWSAQLRHTVRFADAVGKLLKEPDLALLEVGPGTTLTTLARQNPAKQPGQATIHSSPRTCKESETAELLSAAGQLWLAGVEIDWRALHGEAPRRRVPVPTYPFERKRHWIEPYRSASPGAVYTNGSRAAQDKGGTLADHLETMLNGAQITESAPAPSSELETLIQEQLRIMAKQIEVLRHAPEQIGAPGHE
jgi:acyl transferase domain-containing protein